MREPSTVRHYRDRAEAFFQSAQLLGLDAIYGPAVGLLAVHSGIALADAVLVAEEGMRSREEDHAAAPRALEKLCAARRFDDAGVKHLRELVGKKSRFSYGEDQIRDEEFRSAKLKMEQFFKWVYGTFPALARADEADDA